MEITELKQNKSITLSDLDPDVAAVAVCLQQSKYRKLKSGRIILHVTPEGKINVTQTEYEPVKVKLGNL